MRLLQRFLLPALVATVLLSLPVSAAQAGKTTPFSTTQSSTGTTTTTTTLGTPVDVGTRDFSYSGPSAPTGQKPQSKLWYADGSWWGVLYNSAGTTTTTRGWHIYRYDWNGNTWIDTGTVVDRRARAEADAAWSGGKLYISVNIPPGTQATDTRGQILRYSYDPLTKTYSQDAGFPITLETAPVEALVMDRDSAGKLWATWTLDNADGTARSVYVTHTTSDDLHWVTPYIPPVTGATNLDPDDISSVVAFNGKIGLMWSNQTTWNMYFAVHRDGDPDSNWTQGSASSGDQLADDHMNLKSLQADSSGEVVAMWKTSLNAPSDPLEVVGVRSTTGVWRTAVFGTVADDHTRELVMFDKEHRLLYVFASSPCCNGGTIYYKRTSISNLSFPAGKGTPFIQSVDNTHLNNPASSKQPVDSSTGLLVIAADDATHNYMHNTLELGGLTGPPATMITSGPTGSVSSTSATFQFTASPAATSYQCSLDGSAFTSCTSGKTYTGLTEGGHTFQVRGTNSSGTDQTPATRTWTIDQTPPDVPVITAPVDGSLSLTGKYFVNGTAPPNSTVQVYDNGVPYITLTADSTGAWSKWTVADADGAHVYTATSTDPAGNVSAPSLPVTTVVDAFAPVTNIDSGPSGFVHDTSATFQVSANKLATYECSLDGAAYSACAPDGVVDYAGLAEGTHTFQVRATDDQGRVDDTPETRTWTIDLTPPTVTAATPGDGAAGASTTPALSVTFSEPVDPATLNASTITLSQQADGLAIPATVSYDDATRTARLSLDGDLNPLRTYVITVKGGDGGVKDVAGNALAADVTSSFTTAAGPLFTDGFESGNFARWSLVRAAGDKSSTTVQTKKVAAGRYAAQFMAGDHGGLSYARKTFAVGQTDLTASGNFWIEQDADTIPFITLRDANGVEVASVYRKKGSGDLLQVRYAGVPRASTYKTAAHKWIPVSLHVVTAGPSAGLVEVKVAGATVYRTTSASLPATGAKYIQLGNDTALAQHYTLMVDDVLAP